MKPLAFDLFCGLGGWADGLLEEGYEVIGYDITKHEYGEETYRGKLILRNVLEIDGAEFKDAALIVASPPCQEYSKMSLPFSRYKKLADDYRTGRKSVDDLNALFDACFRIQREASAAAGRHIPMVVENVCGAQRWVGRAKAHFGSFYLWGDVATVGGRIICVGGRGESLRMPRRRSWEQAGPALFEPGEADRGIKRTDGGWIGKKHSASKRLSAQVAKIPGTLARFVGREFRPC